MDGLSRIEFSLQTPGTDEEVQAQIAHALGLGLPEVDTGGKQLHIVANGPTAVGFFDRPQFGDTMALNGALGLFTDRNRAPTFWAACDPQEGLVSFLGVAPKATAYLVASKCHPAVFERLRRHDVRLWHVTDHPVPGKRQVPCAVSITTTVAILAHRMGYRRLDFWGWDCCFSGKTLDDVGEHHAGKGDLSTTPDAIEMEIDGAEEHYISNATWACETTDASRVLPVLRWCGTDVAIHGRSFISACIADFAAAPEPELEVAA